MKFIIFLSFCFYSANISGQSSILAKANKFSEEAWFYIDSVQIKKKELKKYCWCDFTAGSFYEDTTAIRMFGQKAKAGVIYLETKIFAKNRGWKYFGTKSNEYSTLFPTPQSDSSVQYILNNKPLKSNDDFWGLLAFINDASFKELKIIGKENLQKQYRVYNKQYGVSITCTRPDFLKRNNKYF